MVPISLNPWNYANICINLNVVIFLPQQLFRHALFVIILLREKYVRTSTLDYCLLYIRFEKLSQKQFSISTFFHITQCIKLLPAPDLTSCKDTEVTLRLNISKIKHNIVIKSGVSCIA